MSSLKSRCKPTNKAADLQVIEKVCRTADVQEAVLKSYWEKGGSITFANEPFEIVLAEVSDALPPYTTAEP